MAHVLAHVVLDDIEKIFLIQEIINKVKTITVLLQSEEG